LHTEPRGLLRITAPVDLGQRVLASLCVAFQMQHPAVEIEAVLTDRMVHLLDEGFDLAIRTGELHDSSLVARRLATVRQGLFASPSWLASHRPIAQPADLADVPHVLFRHRPGAASLSLTSQRGTVQVGVRGTLACGDFLFLRAALMADGGIGPLPLLLAADDVATGRLQRVLPEWWTAEASLWAVCPSTRHLPVRVRLFIEFLAERYAQIGQAMARACQPLDV
jgi:DNA-binding transcriptional LysR family regulator